MSWYRSGYPITVEDSRVGEAAEPPLITSISPLLLTNGDQYFIRLYGIDVKGLKEAAGTEEFIAGLTPCSGGSSLSDWMVDYESYAKTRFLVFGDSDPHDHGTFTGTIEYDKADSARRLTNTCIPQQLDGLMFIYSCVYDVDSATMQLGFSDELKVTYRDPQVIELPSQKGYLMVLARYLHEGAEGQEKSEITADQNNSRSQIVVWWCDNAKFTGHALVGPMVLVDDLQSWQEEQFFRLWVGVPGIALVDREVYGLTFYVYYVLETTELGYGGSGHCDSLHDDISEDDYDDAIAGLGALWGTFKPGIACKRFTWDQLMGAIEEEKDTGPTYRTKQEMFLPHMALEGDLLGLCNFWFADGTYDSTYDFKTPTLSVTSFFDVFSDGCVRFAAPHPLTCGLSQTGLSLYAAVTMKDQAYGDCGPTAPSSTDPGTGHGLWRGRAAPHGRWISVSGSLNKSILGRDFLFTRLVGNQSADMIAASADDKLWIDPGPVQLEDGSFWVMAGIKDLEADIGEITAFRGDRRDGCGGWALLYGGAGSFSTSGGARVLEPPSFVSERGVVAAMARRAPRACTIDDTLSNIVSRWQSERGFTLAGLDAATRTRPTSSAAQGSPAPPCLAVRGEVLASDVITRKLDR